MQLIMPMCAIARGIAAGFAPAPIAPWDWAPAVVAERTIEAERIAGPVRELFDMLAKGEVWTAQGRAVMQAVDCATGLQGADDWVEVVPCLRGWVDCITRLMPDVSVRALDQVARFLDAGVSIAPQLADQARAEFDAQVKRLPMMPGYAVREALMTAQIAWEIERHGLGVRHDDEARSGGC